MQSQQNINKKSYKYCCIIVAIDRPSEFLSNTWSRFVRVLSQINMLYVLSADAAYIADKFSNFVKVINVNAGPSDRAV